MYKCIMGYLFTTDSITNIGCGVVNTSTGLLKIVCIIYLMIRLVVVI